ncbi:MAG: hypothetical protein KDB67_06670 [Gordonia sp.]|uniref:hypothetical protein n=1 Tax=Gordonia sp. (in: high G+C Gram-positive bacteria) TaxID=84139 RepID=UPI001D78A0AA|nr:hypothetical protein [Gordonia sp. (in: high G+C Gram-positive bacteria)]MCB1294349.1 hypothetical protein [Gordonia sp. (in: high G+C Gram-positive bacteria)]
MTRPIGTRTRAIISAGVLLGALVGMLLSWSLTPNETRYVAKADVALLPPKKLSTARSSGFWEVLTGGQLPKTVALIYQDTDRWLPVMAAAADVEQSDLTLTAAAIPETTMLTVSVEAPTSTAAERGLAAVLSAASSNVKSIARPFEVEVIKTVAGSARPVAKSSPTQVAILGAAAGALLGLGAALAITRGAGRHRMRGAGAADEATTRRAVTRPYE